MTDVESIRRRWTDSGIIAREGLPQNMLAYEHVMFLLSEIDRLTQVVTVNAEVAATASLRTTIAELAVAGLEQETVNMPVFVLNDPPEMHDDLINPRPKKHVEFIPHTRFTTNWHGDTCPDCQAEPGVHDRRERELRGDGH